MTRQRTGFLFRPWFLVTFLCLVYSLAVIAIRGGGDPLMLVTIGSRFSPDDTAHAYSDEGYDGQFVYYIARDPSTAIQFIDAPAYRFQRILLPAFGIGLSLQQEALIPWVLLTINLIALAAGTLILEHLLTSMNVSRWYAIGYGLSLGVFGAARLSTTETLAYALVLGGIWLAQQERWRYSAAIFALAALAKETTLIFVAAYGIALIYQSQWRSALLFSIIAVLPFIGWQVILLQHFGEFGIGSGGALATSFEIIPFWGYIRILLEGGIVVFLLLNLLIAPFVILPTLWALWRCWQDYRQKAWTFYTLLLLVNAGIMLFIPSSTYREWLGILRFIVGLQIAVILYAAHKRNHRILRYSTIWFVTSLLIVASDFATS